MTTSQSQDASCFSSIFRRLLCAGGLPTHPSSDTDSPKVTLLKTDSSNKLQSPSPTRTTIPAGVVARLMGLDSFPSSTHASKVSSLGKIMRSRSVGSVDFLPNFDITKQPRYHRRVTTSLSFREVVPTFLQTSSHNHDRGKADAIGKPEMGFTPKEEKSKNLDKGIRRERERVNTNKKKKNTNSQSMKVKSEEEEEEVSSVQHLKHRKKRGENGGRRKVVVDDEFPGEQKKYKSRKRTYNHPVPRKVKHERKGKKQSVLRRRESEYSEEFCMKVLTEVCRLTMEETERDVWVDAKVVNNYSLQEISYEVGQEILQLLVYEMVEDISSSI